MARRTHRPISLAGLRGFEAAARTLSFTRAAVELALTQSSISRQVRALEDEVGRPLFRRRTRALELTDAGRQLYEAVGESLAGIDRAVAGLRGTSRRRRLAVTTVPSFASLMLMPRLPAFSRLHPDVDISIDASDALRDLRAEGYDVAIRYCRVAHAPADGVRLLDEVLVPVLSPALAADLGPIESPAALARATFIVEASHPPHDGFSLDAWHRWFAGAGGTMPDDARRITLTYSHQALQAALGGQGVMLAPTRYAEPYLATGRLLAPFDQTLPSPCAFYLIVDPTARRQRHVDAFVRWLDEAIGTPLGGD